MAKKNTYNVTLREKSANNKGKKFLYLDFYPAIPLDEPKKNKKGKIIYETRREFLGLYVYEPIKYNKRKNSKGEVKEIPVYSTDVSINETRKLHNENTLKKAENIQALKYKQLNENSDLTEIERRLIENDKQEKAKGEKCFVEYFKKLADKRNASNHDNWISAYNYLESFTNGKLTFANLNESFLEDFKEYLLTSKSKRSDKTTLSQNSAVSYFNKVKATLKQAYKDGILQTDLNSKVQPIKAAETRREYLTLDELNKLVKTPCNDNLLKRAALFSALTGLRFSDISKMVWRELVYIESQGYFLNYDQQKTKGVEVLPISEQAYSFTEGTQNPKDMEQDKKVFEGLKYSAYANKHLFQWIGAAGITKDITFHCFRHTFATLQLFHGTDIYTVSKMLGHKDLKTTQVYAKIVDDAKRKAADNIKLDL